MNQGKLFKSRRYFTAGEELIQHGGKTYAFGN